MKFEPITPTTDMSLSVSISIAGGSGTGKTYSAMLLADGLSGGEKFAVIDTENKRAIHYGREFPNAVHFNFGPQQGDEMVGFPPERWIAQLDYLERKGYAAVVIDSFSHAWEGIGGVLEMQAEELERMTRGDASKAKQMGMLAWASVKPRYRRLIERIRSVRICLEKPRGILPQIRQRDALLPLWPVIIADIPTWKASGRIQIFELDAFSPNRVSHELLPSCSALAFSASKGEVRTMTWPPARASTA